MNLKTNLTTINFKKGRPAIIKYIVVHYTANDGDTDEGNGKYFNGYYRGASAHYFVDEDSVTQVVKDSDVAWHCNDTQKYTNGGATFKRLCNNNNSLGIELCSDKIGSEYILTADTQKNAQELIKGLMSEHNVLIDNVIRHFDVSGKICPEPFVAHPEQWVAFKSKLLNSNKDKVQLKYNFNNATMEHLNKYTYQKDLFDMMLKPIAEQHFQLDTVNYILGYRFGKNVFNKLGEK